VIPTTPAPHEDSRILPEAADRRQLDEQFEDVFQLQRNWSLHRQLPIPKDNSLDIPTMALKKPLLTKSPEGHIPCHLGVISIPINLSGVEFLTSLVVLNSHEIDVILGMNWLTKH
jgi:hypothetical protein